MPQRFVIHAGFHKTGTTTLQRLLRRNKDLLVPHMQILLREDIKPLCTAARGYSKTRSELDLGMVRYEMAHTLEQHAAGHDVVLISSEDLSGYMPGRKGLTTYAAAPVLMAALADAVFASVHDADLTFLFTTRSPDAWLPSCYAQHVKAIRMTLSQDDYCRKYADSAHLDDITDDIAHNLPGIRVDRVSLDAASASGFALLDRVSDLTRLPVALRAALPPPAVANRAPSSEVLAGLLALNRSDLSPDELRRRKKALSSKAQ